MQPLCLAALPPPLIEPGIKRGLGAGYAFVKGKRPCVQAFANASPLGKLRTKKRSASDCFNGFSMARATLTILRVLTEPLRAAAIRRHAGSPAHPAPSFIVVAAQDVWVRSN